MKQGIIPEYCWWFSSWLEIYFRERKKKRRERELCNGMLCHVFMYCEFLERGRNWNQTRIKKEREELTFF